jgi:hypothetical protein
MRLDHFITYINVESIDEYLEEYAELGFLPMEHTVRHDPGLRNGFVAIGSEYLEFCWVEDERLFSEVDSEEVQLREARRPFGIGIVADDVQALHDEWIAKGFDIPAVWSKAARDDKPDAPPKWSFQEVPDDLLPGANCFVLTYHSRPNDSIRKVHVAPNSTYAISGVTFVSPDPKSKATTWRNLLSPEEKVSRHRDEYVVAIGPHQARWITPQTYAAFYDTQWTPSPHPYGELAIIHLLAHDLDQARIMLDEAGREVRLTSDPRGNQQLVVVLADGRDGFMFEIQELDIQTWVAERQAKTGESLDVGEHNT